MGQSPGKHTVLMVLRSADPGWGRLHLVWLLIGLIGSLAV